MMLFWPTVAVLGFVALTVVVIVLGTTSTARFEFDRNRVPAEHGAATPPSRTGTGHPAGGSGSAPEGCSPRSGGGASTRTLRLPHRTRVKVLVDAGGDGGAGRATRKPSRGRLRPRGSGASSAHPAVQSAAVAGWWLVVEPDEGEGRQVLAGPFPDQLDAEWAALGSGEPALMVARAVYGVRRGGGALVRRPSPQERSWYAEVGRQLERLGDDWDTLLSDTDPLTTLVVDVAAALLDAGLPVHGSAGPCTDGDPVGGVCLTPDLSRGGILITWRQHDRMTLDQVRGAAADTAVQQAMNAAVAAVLAELGFRVEPVGSTGAHLVVAER
jgi:hypothetical protein